MHYLKTVKEWEELKKRARRRSAEILIFKFSPICGTSMEVEKDFDEWYKNLSKEVDIHALKVDVIYGKELSYHLAEELNLKHESPQAIWLNKDGNLKWNADHEEITSELLTQQIEN